MVVEMNVTQFGEFSTTYIEPWDEIDSLLYFLFYAVAMVLTLVIFTIHSYNIISDLCSKNRSSVNHRSIKPKLTLKYKATNYLTHLCIFLYLTYLIVCTIQMTNSNYKQCVITTYLWTYPWLLSKATMYCILLLRLDIVYSSSVYGYNKYFLYSLMLFVVIASISLSSLLISKLSMDEALFLTDNDQLPNPCFVYYPYWGYTSFLVYDFTANTVCLILFIVPLTRAVRSIRKNNSGNYSKKTSYKMIYVGVKLLIVTAVCVTTTVLTLSLLSSGYLGFMCGVDVVVNCICIVLMTAYYPDHKYYEKICFVCLLCAPNRYRSKYYMKFKSVKKEKLLSPTISNINDSIDNNSINNDLNETLSSPVSSLNPMTIGKRYIELK
eukprot:172099_1